MVTGYSKKGESSKRGNPTKKGKSNKKEEIKQKKGESNKKGEIQQKKGKSNKTKEDGSQFSVQEHLESSRLNDGDLGIPQSDSNSDRINFDQIKVGQTSD